MAATATLRTTYTETTPESATEGDFSAHGWVAADGWTQHPAGDEVGPAITAPGHPWAVGRAASAVVLVQGEEDETETAADFAARVAKEALDRAWGCDHAQPEGDGFSVSGHPGGQDPHTGGDESRTAHVETDPTTAALCLAALKGAR